MSLREDLEQEKKELAEKLKLVEKKIGKLIFPDLGQIYFSKDGSSWVWKGDEYDLDNLNTGNCFASQEVAEKAREMEVFQTKARQMCGEAGWLFPVFNKKGVVKFYPIFLGERDLMNTPLFENEEEGEKFIQENWSEIVKICFEGRGRRFEHG